MAGVTVEELWQVALPGGTVLAAGQAGSNREVTWPALLRSRPPAFDPLRGGEIALVSMQIARMLDERLTLSRIVRSLIEMQVSAIAVAGEIDEEAKQLAEEANTPLLALPPGSNLHRVEQSITRAVVDRRSELHQRGQEIYQQLTELVIAGRGVPAIVERLAELTGRPITLEDDSLNLRVYAGRGPGREQFAVALEQNREEVLNWLHTVPPSPSDPPTAKFLVPSLGMARLAAPIVSRERIAGYLSIFATNGELGELERLAVARGAAACAIEMVKEWAVLEAEDRLQVDLVDDLLTGEFTSAEVLQNRAKRLGFDISKAYLALVIQPRDNAEGSQAPTSRGQEQGTALLQRALERELTGRGVAAMIGLKDEMLTVLYPLTGNVEAIGLKTLATDLARALAAQSGTKAGVGVGRLYSGIEGIRVAHREAQQALAIGNRLFGPAHVTYFGDLGLYRLLLGVKDARDLQAFFDETLARLVAYDGRSDGELVKTLAAYFACHASPTDAARKLHLHRNTLLYRLRRIQEITGLDLEDAEVCLKLHLALHIKDVLRAIAS